MFYFPANYPMSSQDGTTAGVTTLYHGKLLLISISKAASSSIFKDNKCFSSQL